ncbi:MAG: copper chaperone PCu(A)C [Rhodospirillales bacterium]|nr:copper chaperone PCu(A)C [Rhodospirillales bacterium]
MRGSSRPLPSSAAGAFLSITNKGPDHDRLVAASSPLAERIELYGIKVVEADIEMRPLAAGITVQAGHTTTLKPRGYHLLLQGLTAPLAKGSTLPVTLTFEKAGAVALEFAVEEPGLIGEAILNEEHHRG